ncbi:MAG: radical SAM family heme chaperone HemW [Phycisphaerales bacterium]|nr:radical SAM family heme chaperone HemW [Phycisphaerales bacterium]
MAGIYIHVPFCKKACNYCNFHFSTKTNKKTTMVDCLIKEIALQKVFLQNHPIETVYFGGGTPSLLTPIEIERILESIYKNYKINEPEISLEINPDDVNIADVKQWKLLGINRTSLGVQSFHDEDLQWMNRAHNAQQAQQAIDILLTHHTGNISVDLIYGLPTHDINKWSENIKKVIAYDIPHLSCYCLTVEKKTMLSKMIDNKLVTPLSEEMQVEQFLLLLDFLEHAQYEHYEISNFAKIGFRSRHNSNYWKQMHYLGIGPSAHSYNGLTRQWNCSNNQLYINAIQNNQIPSTVEQLTEKNKINEYIMTAIRTIEGIDLSYIRLNFFDELYIKIENILALWVLDNKMEQVVPNRYVLNRAGKLIADRITASLFQ